MTDFNRRRALLTLGSVAATVAIGTRHMGIAAADGLRKKVCSDNELFGSSHPLFPNAGLRDAAKAVVRLVWKLGNAGATGVLLDQNWILTARHCCYPDVSECDGHTAILAFDEGSTVQTRSYFVLRPDLGYIDDHRPDVVLDFALCRYTPAFPLAKQGAFHTIARGVRLPMASSAEERRIAYRATVIGHPQTNCGEFRREGAFKTLKHVTVWKPYGYASSSFLDSDSVYCPGASGSPVVDHEGGLLGIVSAMKSEPERPQIVTLLAVRDYLLQSGKVGAVDFFSRELGIARIERIASKQVDETCEIPNDESDNRSPLTFVEEPVPGSISVGVAKIISCVGYVGRPGNDRRLFGTCFLIGTGWILTAKHVVDSPANAERMSVNFSLVSDADFKNYDLWARQIPFCSQQYYSSDDRIYSYDGKESVLDYALIRLDTASPYFEEVASKRYLTAAVAPKSLPASIWVPQHRREVGKLPLQRIDHMELAQRPVSRELIKLGMPRSGVVHDNLLLAHDTRRLFYAAAARAGASGAPILDTSGHVIGLHTNGRNLNCSAQLPADVDRDQGCADVPRRDRHRFSLTEQLSFGTKLTAIAQDLSLRHGLDISKIEGLSGLLPCLDREAFQSATNK